ncbi:hypothetical protein [Chondromyces apiculatus]|uniref:Uncharacterized protein n=1 Tax=Chondromyces apiculatus DSM 436 TaxID=1192034 RepID=A0A017T0X5_9BACT|nr:hypothetical protein [Chondromyces apiculatus]EYF02878.1 Hypothetical protein CAP_6458 [Chondromyces apiculatus DSM 436]
MSGLATMTPGGAGPRPYYELSVLSVDVSCEIRVNDVPVLRLPSGRVETAFDVNPYVITGMNMLSLSVRAARGKAAMGRGSACAVTLGVRSRPGADDLTPAASLVFRAPEGTPAGFEESPGYGTAIPPFVRHAGLTATQPFQLDTPFLPWSWTSAPPIEATEATRAAVLAEYRHIWELLRARDVDALVRACGEQARDYQDAYGLPDLATANRKLGIARTLGDPEVAVEDFPEEVLTMELLGDRRLVQLVDAEGRSPLRLRVTTVENMVGRFNVVLCRDGGKWTIAR